MEEAVDKGLALFILYHASEGSQPIFSTFFSIENIPFLIRQIFSAKIPLRSYHEYFESR